MKKKHILVISQYFYPEQFRINDICKEWINRDYKVTVITGIPNYPYGKYYEGYGIFKKRKETYEGIDVIRIPLVPRGTNSLMLALNYISFVISGFFWKIFTKIKADYVFIFEVSPMTQALPGIWYAKKRNIPCYIYVQDLWPENVEIITGIKNKAIINPITKMVKYIYKNVDIIFTTSKSFVDSIVNRGVEEKKIKFWPQYAEEFYKPIEDCNVKEIPKDSKMNIVFAGNIGEAQGLDILVHAAVATERAGLKEKIRFNIIGDGRYKLELIKLTKDNKVSSMFNFIDRQPAERIPEFMAVSDIAFLSLKDHPLFSKTIPAKLQSYMACGMPIIASASGETSEIIKKSESGYCSKSGDINELVKNIIKIYKLEKKQLEKLSENSIKYYKKKFDKKVLLDYLDNFFES